MCSFCTGLAGGNCRAARPHWQHALDLYAQLDVPEAREMLGHPARYGAVIGIAP